jgi:Tfp pilus assembly protein PilP
MAAATGCLSMIVATALSIASIEAQPPKSAAPAAQAAKPPAPAQPPAKPAAPAPPAAKPVAPAALQQPAKPGAPPVSPSAAAPAGSTPPPAASTAGKPATNAPPVETYIYRAEGRRDPFQNLLNAGSGAMISRKGEGPSGMTLGEVSVRGVLQSRGTLVAMIEGPDKRTYIVHQGDRLLDGTIKTITPQGLVVVQEVNDPLSLVKQREIRKLLRSLEDAKE